ncbi:hypothetical protein TSUD_311220 [Trifolium subterraneum]|uniref:Serine-threonine/tyrosine-protein kinase catalytic domain-containing protein n=1 Tax=Trifolium subterraneum TaxID=3900 RepID=A0A2Z6ME78_TRISU|nr:hypothetical protein TSUD_311220 [Trifolium subterraneum]
MSCFSCFVSRSKKDVSRVEVDNGSRSTHTQGHGGMNVSESERNNEYSEGKGKTVRSGKSNTAAASFGFRELASATKGFNEANLIGEEYAMSGKLTLKSDIYSFGVVLLELITGRRAIDTTRKPGEQNLVSWSRPYFNDRRKFVQMADPLLQGRFPTRCLHQAIAITGMCLQEQPKFRPLIGDIVVALEYLASQSKPEDHGHGVRSPLMQSISDMHRC